MRNLKIKHAVVLLFFCGLSSIAFSQTTITLPAATASTTSASDFDNDGDELTGSTAPDDTGPCNPDAAAGNYTAGLYPPTPTCCGSASLTENNIS